MGASFSGFKEKDFVSVDNTTWRKIVGKMVENRLSDKFEQDFKNRIPYHRKTIYWGTPLFFKDKLMKYCYSALFLMLEKDFMKIGLKIERGFINEEKIQVIQPNDRREEVLMLCEPSSWDWYRLEQRLKDEQFCNILNEKLQGSFELVLYIGGDWNSPKIIKNTTELIDIISNWETDKEYIDKWGDLLLYKVYSKQNVLAMRSYEILDEITDTFESLSYIYDYIKSK